MGKKIKYSCGRTIAEKSASPSLSYVDKKANIILENVTCLTVKYWVFNTFLGADISNPAVSAGHPISNGCSKLGYRR